MAQATCAASLLVNIGTPWASNTPGCFRRSRIRHASLQGERMERIAHLPLERPVDKLVLLNPRFATKRFRDHGRRIVVAVPGKVADRDLRIWDSDLDQPLDFLSLHRHGPWASWSSAKRLGRPYRPGATPRSAPRAPLPQWAARPERSTRSHGLTRAAAPER